MKRLMFFVNYFVRREPLKKLLTDAEIDFKKVCWYCKDCKKCERFNSIRSEFKKKGFSTFNKGIRYCDVRDHKQFELDLLEILVFECNFYSKSSNLLENANMLSLTKEATNKDHSLKTQLTINSKSSKEKISGKRVEKSGVF